MSRALEASLLLRTGRAVSLRACCRLSSTCLSGRNPFDYLRPCAVTGVDDWGKLPLQSPPEAPLRRLWRTTGVGYGDCLLATNRR